MAIDPSEGFEAHARRAIADARAEFHIGDAQALPVDDRAFDAVVACLVINFVPNISKAIAEMLRVTCPGGTVTAYVWDYAGEMQMMRRF
jgi:ubiquinone/menaquinone biosynthesis C-methylase UbiE